MAHGGAHGLAGHGACGGVNRSTYPFGRFTYTLERTPVANGIWFNRASRSDFELRKLMVSRRYRTMTEWESVLAE